MSITTILVTLCVAYKGPSLAQMPVQYQMFHVTNSGHLNHIRVFKVEPFRVISGLL